MSNTYISKNIRKLLILKGYKMQQFFLTQFEARFSFIKTRKTGVCPECRTRCRYIEEVQERTIRDLDCLGRTTHITFQQFKIKCTCGYRGLERLEFVEKYSFYTKRFEELVFLLCQKMTIKDTASSLYMRWDAVKDIDKKYLQKRLPPLSEVYPEQIGMDEIAYQKGHQYITVIRNVILKQVIWTGLGRKKETVDKFYSELGKEKCAKIKVVVMDMWDPYIASTKEYCPNADIVFDKFHVSKKVNEALDSVRKQEFGKAEKEKRIEMKDKRFIILSRQKNLDEKDLEFIGNLKIINEPLYEAYLLKEQILDIFDEESLEEGRRRFEMWFSNVEKTGITAYNAVVKTIKNYWYGIENYFKHRLTNAGSEGFNNKINVIKRKAYGFRDLVYFMLKIRYSCGNHISS